MPATRLLKRTGEIQQLFNNPRLTVELVPSTCWYSNVRNHVSKAAWDTLRKATYHQANGLCKICGGRGPRWPVECHEMWQYDDACFIQTLTGLIALCPRCHETKHIGLAGLRGRDTIAKAHLAKINGWTPAQTERYLEVVWAVWAERSRHHWQQDVRWLEHFGVHIEPRTREGYPLSSARAVSCHSGQWARPSSS